MATKKTAGSKPSKQSITVDLGEDSRPTGLMPSTFPPEYVAGSVAPFFLSSNFLGETPSLPMIDLALSKEGACPVHWWGMLYPDWEANPRDEGTTVFLTGYENRRPNNERKR